MSISRSQCLKSLLGGEVCVARARLRPGPERPLEPAIRIAISYRLQVRQKKLPVWYQAARYLGTRWVPRHIGT
eukprot:3898786-Rhodomonas_salina.1